VTCNRFDVVRVPFPFTDKKASKHRPALVLSVAATFNTPSGHAVLAMITSAANTPWPQDCPIEDLAAAGLPAASVVRCKLFTLDLRLVNGQLGRLSARDQQNIKKSLAKILP
jgi:mRNA interferase MazF